MPDFEELGFNVGPSFIGCTCAYSSTLIQDNGFARLSTQPSVSNRSWKRTVWTPPPQSHLPKKWPNLKPYSSTLGTCRGWLLLHAFTRLCFETGVLECVLPPLPGGHGCGGERGEGKIDVSNLALDLKWTPILFVWRLLGCKFKNKHQKDMWWKRDRTTCLTFVNHFRFNCSHSWGRPMWSSIHS